MGPCVLSTDGRFRRMSVITLCKASMGPCVLSTDGRPLFRWARAGIKLQWDRAFSARMAGERLYGNRHRSQASMGPCVLSTEGAEGRRGGAERHGASMGPCVLSTDGP